jgi:hypothetical protein
MRVGAADAGRRADAAIARRRFIVELNVATEGDFSRCKRASAVVSVNLFISGTLRQRMSGRRS